jgi:hypothetical protein
VGGEVAVAEPEPGRPDSVERQLVAHRERLVGSAPALFLMDAATERVHDGVEIGAHPQPEQSDVIGGVPDHGDVRLGCCGAQPAQEAGGSDAPRGDHDVHAAQSDTPTNRSADRLNITRSLDFVGTTRV